MRISAKSLEGMHAGEAMLVIGNAPSLNDVPEEVLMSVPSIGCNRILQHPWFVPTYVVVSDRRVYYEELSNYECTEASMMLSTTIFDPKIRCYDTKPPGEPKFPYYAWRVGASSTPYEWETFDRPLCSMASITGPMFQAAAIMGARRIGIVGIDMEAPKTGNSIHFYENEGKWEGYKGRPDYSPGCKVVRDKSVDKYHRAFKEMRGRGIKVANLSPWHETRFSQLFGVSDPKEFLC
jgi:hypothetical protein